MAVSQKRPPSVGVSLGKGFLLCHSRAGAMVPPRRCVPRPSLVPWIRAS